MSFRFWPKLRVSVCMSMYVCVYNLCVACMRVGCTRVCGCCCIAIDVHRLAEHYLLCDLERAREHAQARLTPPRVFSRAARILGAAFFLVSAKKRNFFTLRRNRTRIRMHTLNPGAPSKGGMECSELRGAHVHASSCTTLCVSSCAQRKISN